MIAELLHRSPLWVTGPVALVALAVGVESARRLARRGWDLPSEAEQEMRLIAGTAAAVTLVTLTVRGTLPLGQTVIVGAVVGIGSVQTLAWLSWDSVAEKTTRTAGWTAIAAVGALGIPLAAGSPLALLGAQNVFALGGLGMTIYTGTR